MEFNKPHSLRLLLIDTMEEFGSSKTSITIGRESICDLVIRETFISRSHAEIFFLDDGWYLMDCNSVNGTWLNDQRLNPMQHYPLKPRDVIKLGKNCEIFVLNCDEPPVTTAIESIGISQDTCGLELPPDFSCQDAPAPAQAPTYMPSQVSPPPPAPSMAPRPYAPPPPAPMCAPSRAPAPTCAPSQAPAPKKKGGFLSSLFGGKKNGPPVPAAPSGFSVPSGPEPEQPITPDDVQFRGTAPQTINPGEYFPVKIMMYREDDYQRADRESAAVADKTKSASSSVFQATRGQQFRIALQSPDVELDCETQMLSWNGKFATADFDVYLPETFDKKQLRLHGRVYSGDAVLTDLKLILQIGATQSATIPCEKVRLRSAFISYASADRAKVVARIQGIQLACPDMDLFFDVESLRRGENWESRLYREISGRDLFYLFWSTNAAASDWVHKELQYALTQKTVDFIEPIPLQGPEVCPPPESLMGKHFNDWTLRYLGNQ